MLIESLVIFPPKVDPLPFFGGGGPGVSDPDPHKYMSPGSGSAWTNADPDPGGFKA